MSETTVGIDRSKAAKLYIDQYYSNLLEKTRERQERLVDKPSILIFKKTQIEINQIEAYSNIAFII